MKIKRAQLWYGEIVKETKTSSQENIKDKSKSIVPEARTNF